MAIVTTPLGFQKPDGNELTRNGDDILRANADKAEQRIQEDRGRLNNAESAANALTTRVTATETKNTAQDNRLTGVESKNAMQDATLNNHKSRVESLETLGGLAPGDVSDATVRDLIANPASTTAAELAGAIAAQTPTASAADPSGGDDTTALNALLAANAGKTVTLRGGRTYRISAELTLATGTTLDLNGATLDATTMPAGTALGQKYAIKSAGTLGANLPTTTAIPKWGRTVAGISSTATLAVGDLVLISNDERPIPGMTRTVLDKAELNTVQSVDSATQITVSGGALFAYGATSLTVRKVTPAENVTVKNGRIIMGGIGSAHNGINVQNGRNVTVENVTIVGAEDQAIGFQTVWGGRVSGCDIRNSTSSTTLGNTGYAVSISEAAAHIAVEGNQFYNCRHFVAGGGSWPSAFVDITGNHGRKASDFGYDCHEPTLYWSFRNNTATGVVGGFIIRGQHITVDGNTVTDATGVAVRCASFDGVSEQVGLTVTNNRISKCAAGIEVDGKNTGGDTVDAIKKDLIVSGNTVREVTYSGIRVRHFKGAILEGNHVQGVAGEDGIIIDGLSVAVPGEDLTVSDNQVREVSGTSRYGIRINNAIRVLVDGCAVSETTAEGINLTGCFDASVTGCRTYRANSAGLRIDGGARVNVTGGNYSDAISATGDGIRVTLSSDVSIIGTTTKNSRSGI
ncbi:MAG: right-handed parallel beta-helix repeat-containing protein, partial [Dietzia sp.]|nr:right-handed parallel beta-helix repeat-containing protein [Dietzia sp.]